MIQFTAASPGGDVLGLGLSFGNLERMQAGDPAIVQLGRPDGPGRIILACANDEQEVAGVMARFPGDHVVGLSARTVGSLRSGEAFELPLGQLGVPLFSRGILFAGPTEFEVVEQLRATGFLDATVQLEGLEEYLRHERGEVVGCAQCRSRSHGKPTAPDAPSAAPTVWRDWLFAHPYVGAFGLLGLFALIGLAMSLIFGR